MPGLVDEIDEPFLAQQSQHGLQIFLAELFARRERQLERRTLDVVEQDLQIIGIDEGVLRRPLEKAAWVLDDELVDWPAAGHHDRHRARTAPPRPTGPLPCRSDRIWVPGHHAHVQYPDVDTELERAGRHGASAQPALDVAPSNREIASSTTPNRLAPPGRSRQAALR